MILTADIIVDSLIPLLNHDDTISFLLTCKEFYSFTEHNSVWRHLVKTADELDDSGVDDEYFGGNWRNRYLFRGPTKVFMWTRRDDSNHYYDMIGSPPPVFTIGGGKLLVQNKASGKYEFNSQPEVFNVPSQPTEISTRNMSFPKLLSISTITGSRYLLKEKKPTRIRINPRNIHEDPYYPIFHHFQQRGAELINIPIRNKRRTGGLLDRRQGEREEGSPPPDGVVGVRPRTGSLDDVRPRTGSLDASYTVTTGIRPRLGSADGSYGSMTSYRPRIGSVDGNYMATTTTTYTLSPTTTLSPTNTHDNYTLSLPALEPFASNGSSHTLYYTTSSSSNNSTSTNATSILPPPSQLFHLEEHHRILKRFKFAHFPETVLLIEDVGLVAVVGPADMAMLSEEIKLPNNSNKAMVVIPATNNMTDCIQIRGVFESKLTPPKRYLVVLDRFGSIYSISTTDIYKVTDIPLYPVKCLEDKIRKSEKIKKYPRILPHEEITFERIQAMDEQSDSFIAYSKQGNVIHNLNGRLFVHNQLQYIGVKDIHHTRGYYFALTKNGGIYAWPDGKFDYTQFHQLDFSGYFAKVIATTPHSFIAIMSTTQTPRRQKQKLLLKPPPPKVKRKRGFFSFIRDGL